MDRTCIHCGKTESDHCVFEASASPDGCRCDPLEWGNPKDIPAVCGEFKGQDRCNDCEHDQRCHKE